MMIWNAIVVGNTILDFRLRRERYFDKAQYKSVERFWIGKLFVHENSVGLSTAFLNLRLLLGLCGYAIALWSITFSDVLYTKSKPTIILTDGDGKVLYGCWLFTSSSFLVIQNNIISKNNNSLMNYIARQIYI
ncbi:MAG: hypothetical protein NHB32_04550 [Fischerella sp. CENA71]|nr:hypothetical protein [Fischerella sp. CENA71]